MLALSSPTRACAASRYKEPRIQSRAIAFVPRGQRGRFGAPLIPLIPSLRPSPTTMASTTSSSSSSSSFSPLTSILLCAVLCFLAPAAHAASDFVAPGAVMAQQQRQQRDTPALAPAPSRSKGFARSARGREGEGGTKRSPAPPPSLEVIRGTVRVSDGDTIEITTTSEKKAKIRIWGIDAPESKQSCTSSSSEEYPCGDAATRKLRDLLGVKEEEEDEEEDGEATAITATCEVKARDQYGRAVARCFPGDVSDSQIEAIDKSDGEDRDKKNKPLDVGLEMVASGNAVAYRQFSRDYYDEAERSARDGSRGIWDGAFEVPEDWRRERRIEALQKVQQRRAPSPGPLPLSSDRKMNPPPPPSPSASSTRKGEGEEQREHDPGCDIKGNISGDGSKRYHLPGGASYDAVKIDARRGERWFCSEGEAKDAGWQRARDGGRPPATSRQRKEAEEEAGAAAAAVAGTEDQD